MFGEIKISHAGRSFYSNVALREHHKFARGEQLYLYVVDKMSARPISDKLADLIDQVAANPGCLVSEEAMVELRRVDLVGDGTSSPVQPAAETDQPDAARLPRRQPVTSIALFVAQKCNLRCVYCYGEGGEYSEAGMMDENTALAAVDWLVANSLDEKNIQVGYFGGEPLLNFGLMKKVAAHAREQAAAAGKSVTFSLTTNGTMLNDEIIEFLVAEQINPLISYDGGDYQDRQRPLISGRGSNKKVMENVERLRKAFPRLRGRATLYGDGDPYKVKQGMEAAGFTTCIIAKASPVIARSEAPPEPSEAELAKSKRMIEFTRGEIDKVFDAIRERRIAEDNPPSLLADLSRLARAEKKHHGCGMGKDMAGISASGDVYPCHRFVGLKDMLMGNIRDYKAGETTPYHKALVDDAPGCKTCWARYMCGGGCMYMNKALTGDLRRPDTGDCDEKRAGFEEIVRIHCDLDKDDRDYIAGVVTRASKPAGVPAVRTDRK
jgi:uncharacterized protein